MNPMDLHATDTYEHISEHEVARACQRMILKSRINELYQALRLIEEIGGASPELTAITEELGNRMADLRRALARLT